MTPKSPFLGTVSIAWRMNTQRWTCAITESFPKMKNESSMPSHNHFGRHWRTDYPPPAATCLTQRSGDDGFGTTRLGRLSICQARLDARHPVYFAYP